MQLRYIFALFGGAMLAGWLMPFGQTPQTLGSAPMPQVDAQPAADSVAADEELLESDGVVLTRSADGHFYANAGVNTGASDGAVRFLVDTGASAIALTGADAQALGIEWDDSELQLVGRGVNGDVYGKPIMLKSVQVGDIIAYDVQAAIITDGLDVSLLGQSFLSKVGNVNIQENQMTLE